MVSNSLLSADGSRRLQRIKGLASSALGHTCSCSTHKQHSVGVQVADAHAAVALYFDATACAGDKRASLCS
jgi:hypothetical protein